MVDNIKDFFKGYRGSSLVFANRVCTEVMRNGIADMDTLCRMLEKEPEKFRQMRNIGTKSIEVIAAVYSAYKSEKGGAT